MVLLLVAAVSYIVWKTCSARAAAARPLQAGAVVREEEEEEANDDSVDELRYERLRNGYNYGYNPEFDGMNGFMGGMGLGAMRGNMMGPRINYGYGPSGYPNDGYGLTREPGFKPRINTGGWEYGSGIGGYTPGPGWAGGGDEPPPPRRSQSNNNNNNNNDSATATMKRR